ncbi:MAG: hypothetical protein OSA98_04790 [Rubripirellula sp.]|nr:hypothetical protein [Rubripirellula sp.]
MSMHANGEGVNVDCLQAGVGMQAAVTLDQANGESKQDVLQHFRERLNAERLLEVD